MSRKPPSSTPPPRPGRPDPMMQVEALVLSGKLDEARTLMARLLAREPGNGLYCMAMADIAERGDRFPEQVYFLERATTDPRIAWQAWRMLAQARIVTLDETGALAAANKAVELMPGDPNAWLSLAMVHQECHRHQEAERIARKALELAPDHVPAARLLGAAMLELGESDECVDLLAPFGDRHPEDARLQQQLAAASNYAHGVAPERVLAFHLAAGRGYTRELPDLGPLEPRAPLQGRKIRIGVAASELRDHAVARFLEPIFSHLDRSRFELFAWHTSIRFDSTTQRLKDRSDRFEHITRLSHEEFARSVRSHKLDVYLEVAGFTAETLIATAAFRVAPVQVAMIGYPHTTGVQAIDYRLVDALTDPPEPVEGYPHRAQSFASEKLVRLRDGRPFLCYSVRDDAPLPDRAARTAALGGNGPDGGVVFGSFNAWPKINATTIRAWAAVLAATPGSRLVLKSVSLGSEATRTYAIERLTAAGIARDRLEIIPATKGFAEHMACYNRVDIALDAFPYGGTTTTCDAMLMGVPVVTLVGQTHASRVGLSLLSCVGMADLAAGSIDGYVQAAAGLARDRDRMMSLHRDLRQRFVGSVLCDQAGYAAAVGDLLEQLVHGR